MRVFERISYGIDCICESDKNPIEEIYEIKKFVLIHLKDEKIELAISSVSAKIIDRNGINAALRAALSRAIQNITKNIQFDTSYYYVSRYSGASIPEFHRIDLRLGWKPSENLDASLMAQNIGNASHQEFNGGFERGTETQRGLYAKLTAKF